jgi:hypothetical protein
VPASSFCEPDGDVKPATWDWFALNDPEGCSNELEFPLLADRHVLANTKGLDQWKLALASRIKDRITAQ